MCGKPILQQSAKSVHTVCFYHALQLKQGPIFHFPSVAESGKQRFEAVIWHQLHQIDLSVVFAQPIENPCPMFRNHNAADHCPLATGRDPLCSIGTHL